MPLTLQCSLCPRYCVLREGQRGDCKVRIHLDGKVQTLVYGKPCAVNVDPIEKKPLFHFIPRSNSFSIATAGCNLHCKYCQNWQISQSRPEDTNNIDLPPELVIKKAIETNCKSISYTYSDPIIFYEYMYDTAIIAHKNNIKNVMVTAGYINETPLIDVCKYIDAANIDLKGITNEFYQKMSQATLQPVLDSIKTMIKQNVWVELTNLVVPGWNDKEKDVFDLCKWIKDNVGPNVPLHFSRFWPNHQLRDLPSTPIQTINMAWDIGKKTGLNYVYVGNVPGHPGNNTYCPYDGKLLIERKGYLILQNNFINGKCKFCDNKIPGVWI